MSVLSAVPEDHVDELVAGVGALDAYGDGVEHRIDLATVNGRVFVQSARLSQSTLNKKIPPNAPARRAVAPVPVVATDPPDLPSKIGLPTGQPAEWIVPAGSNG